MTKIYGCGCVIGVIAPFVFLVAPVWAQSIDCRNPQTQRDLNRCSEADYRAADRQLNETYQQLRRRIREFAGNRPAVREQENRLVDAQLAWITFRDRHCAFVRSRVEGGSILPLAVNRCLERLTKERTQELALYLREGAI
ncbi:MAG: DUF1311 domain-containing protein [Oscillatoriales cyanobacterium SM2_2_1]|nr:DUF1311 domain-containing protein [Oscillatoriales cyanobacterium SM2_2_1]